MVIESAEIRVLPGMEDEFERAVEFAVPLFVRAKGCTAMQLQRGVEDRTSYRLQVHWTTLEDHTIHFRGSEDFQEWRRLVGPFFDGAPSVTHFTLAVKGF